MRNVLASGASSMPSRRTSASGPSRPARAQRLIEATQSSAVTGVPSCHKAVAQRDRPGQLVGAKSRSCSTICGLTASFASSANSVS